MGWMGPRQGKIQDWSVMDHILEELMLLVLPSANECSNAMKQFITFL